TDATVGDPPSGDDVVLAQFPHTGLLAVGASYTRSEQFLLPPAFQGRYHLFVRTDSGGAIFENGQKSNNTAEAAQHLDAMPIPYADLVIPTVTAPTTPPAAGSGQPISISWTVANHGIGTTNTSSWNDTVFLASDPDGKTIVANLGTFTHTGVL